jgi:hypothetical protein
MVDDTPTRNIALLIDADNASWHAIDPVLTVLAELGPVNVRRVYGNWTKPGLKGWRDMTVRHGIEPQQQFDLTKGKNATDMKMTIDAMDLLFRGRVQGFGIMSSDSDFMPLAMRLRQDGLPVYGFGDAKTPAAFKHACTRFIDVGALLASTRPAVAAAVSAEEDAPAAESKPPARRSRGGRGRGKAATTEAVPTPIDDAEEEDDIETSLAAVLPPSIGARGAVKAPDEELLTLLIDAYDATKRDERGFVNLSSMAQLAANRSSFDVRNYGYRRLSDLMEAVPNFQSERRDNGRIYVKRVR